MPTTVLDIEQHLLLLELEAPFDKRDVQLARRRMAKRWHPDVAPAGQAVRARAPPEGDQRGRRPARAPGRGLARRQRLAQRRASVSAAAARREREEAGRRAYEAEQRARAHAKDRAEHDPFGSRVPDHSVVHRYARCLSYPEWGVGTVAGIYFSTEPSPTARRCSSGRACKFSHGIRTVPAGSMSFVDFSKPDPAEERVERFLIAAQRAMAEGEYELAAQRLIYARDAEPRNVAVLRLMTLAFWQAGKLDAAARAVRDWARVDGARPAAHRFAARIYEDMGAIDLAEEAAERAAERGPADAGAWERLGRLRLALLDREGALDALRRALALGAGEDVHDARRAGARDRAEPRRRLARRNVFHAFLGLSGFVPTTGLTVRSAHQTE